MDYCDQIGDITEHVSLPKDYIPDNKTGVSNVNDLGASSSDLDTLECKESEESSTKDISDEKSEKDIEVKKDADLDGSMKPLTEAAIALCRSREGYPRLSIVGINSIEADLKEHDLIHGIVILDDITFYGTGKDNLSLMGRRYNPVNKEVTIPILTFKVFSSEVKYNPYDFMSVGDIWGTFDEIPEEIFTFENPIIAEVYIPVETIRDGHVLSSLPIGSVRTLVFVSKLQNPCIMILSNIRGDQCVLSLQSGSNLSVDIDVTLDSVQQSDLSEISAVEVSLKCLLTYHQNIWGNAVDYLSRVLEHDHGPLAYFMRSLDTNGASNPFYCNFMGHLTNTFGTYSVSPILVKQISEIQYSDYTEILRSKAIELRAMNYEEWSSQVLGYYDAADKENKIVIDSTGIDRIYTSFEIWDMSEVEKQATLKFEPNDCLYESDICSMISKFVEVWDYALRDSEVVVKAYYTPADVETVSEPISNSDSTECEKFFVTCSVLNKQFEPFIGEQTYMCMSKLSGEDFRIYRQATTLNVLRDLSFAEFQELLKAHFVKLKRYLRLMYTYRPGVAEDYAKSPEQTERITLINKTQQEIENEWHSVQ